MGFLGGKKKNVKPDFTGLQLQTAVSTLPIPLLWGRQKMTGNLIWYNGFTAYKGNKGKGGKSHALSGLGGGNNAETDYRADIILALCEGPILDVGFTWQNQSLYNYHLLMMNLFGGGSGPAGEQDVWVWTEVFYPSQAVAYAGTAYMAAAWYQMGTTPEIGNLAFEVIGNMSGTGANGVDADPAPVIFDFLTNARYGAGFDPASIDQTTLFGPGGDASLQTYCKSLGHRLLAADHVAGGGVLDPRPLAANLQLRGGLDRRSTQVHPLRRHRRPTSATSRPSAATSQHPLCRPARQRHRLAIAGDDHRRLRPTSSSPTAAWFIRRTAFR